MLKHHKINPLTKILIAILALFTVQANCNVSPTDERLQPVVNQEVLTQKQFMEQLAILDYGMIPPPWITEPAENPAEGGLITIGGWGYTQSDLKSREIPTVNLYRLKPKGCSGDFDIESEIGKAQSLSNKWTFENIEVRSGDIIGAVISIEDGKKSNIGNVVIISPETFSPRITRIVQPGVPGVTVVDAKLKIFLGEKFVPVTMEGTGIPYACVGVFERSAGDNYYLQEGVVDSNGKWSIKNIPVHDGPNVFVVKSIGENRIDSFEEKITLVGEAGVKLQWPIGKMVKKGVYEPDYSAHIEAWYGPNDFHRTFYGTLRSHNGLDIAKGRGAPIIPVAPGIVIRADNKWAGGKIVIIDHGRYGSMYLHLDSISVKKDQAVEITEELGKMGNTGVSSDGVHLHVNLFIWPANGKDKDYWKKQSTSDLANLRLGLIRVNINPPKNIGLGPSIWNRNKTEDSGSSYLIKCMTEVNVWNVDWSKIPVNWTEGGTYFRKMKPNESCNK